MKSPKFISTFPIILLIMFFMLNINFSQTTSLEIGYPHAFPGLDNNMKIVVENIPCNRIYVKSKKGKIISTEKACHFVYISNQVGSDSISIFSVNKTDTLLVERRRILVKKWPRQPAEFGKRVSGEMTISEFKITQEVIARIEGFDMSGKHKVKSYEITLIRSNEKILKLENKGGKIESKNLKQLMDIKQNDIVIFTEIYAFMPGEQETTRLNDIRIKIKN